MDQIVGGVYVFIGVAFIGVAAGIILDHVSVRAEKQFRKLTAEATRGMAEGVTGMGMLAHTTHFDLDKELTKVYQKLYKDAGLIALVVLVGSVCMMALEVIVTMTTVGYGDRTPTNDASKLFVCCFILVSFGVISVSISNLAAVPFEVGKLTNISKVLSQFGETLDAQELTALCENDEIRKLRNRSQIERFKYNPHVSRAEFILWQLQKQGESLANRLEAHFCN
ncbi:unnamed protein product [Polarella glacialis]|uniref:Potassium channel domain-containing protein n=1 Tax=Polarella glacialis TaxID=89957 RepID=A0A813LC23_POLGL|nr:unnamed protein product [Polarella glacialis]